MSISNYGHATAQAIPVSDISNPIPDWGADFFSDTAAHVGDWTGIQALTDTVIDLTSANWGGSAITAVTIKAGTRVSGRFPWLKLASGTVVAYRALAPNT